MYKINAFLVFVVLLILNVIVTPAYCNSNLFQRRWHHVSETSAVIYWQLNDISKAATSYVEYGTTEIPDQRTAETVKPRWAHLHRLTGLEPGRNYYYRMVVVDPLDGEKKESELVQITTARKENAIYIPNESSGKSPYILDKENAHYVLKKDIVTDGTAIIIQGSGITFDLDGKTIVFGNNTSEQVFGVQITNGNNCKVVNGLIIQGKRSADYSNAVRSFRSDNNGLEICGISTDVHLKNAQPMAFRHAGLKIHHNDIYSRVTELDSRHYPGNTLLRIDASGENISIHDNLLTEGCHLGIVVRNQTKLLSNVEIAWNDIRHHQQYVNGYAISPGSGAKVHHNRITSTGRGVHITGENTEFFNNYIDIRGHQHLSDLPENTRPFHHRQVELHGVKFEGSRTKNCKIYNNFVRITQHQPVDSDGQGDPVDKMENGVYFRSKASSIEKGKIVDLQQNWEKDRWRFYYVKYDPGMPPVLITGNDETTLYGDFNAVNSAEYTVYMKWIYVPPTPLNVACYDPNGMNEIHGNTFIGITTYKNTRHGGYGDSGQWATSVMFVGMDKGAAQKGNYSAWIHDNNFLSNDLFLNSYTSINMDIKMENNTFTLLNEPFSINRESRIRDVGADFENMVKANGNIFKEE